MNENTPDVVEVQNSDKSFPKEMAQTAAVNAAATAGTLLGLFAIGFAVDRVQKFRTARAEKKLATNTPS